MLPGSAGPTVLTEPYSLPRLLMATKNRLATPKMLTTPRSTGDSSSRPGGGARVIPGHRTLGPSFPPGPLLPPGTPTSGGGDESKWPCSLRGAGRPPWAPGAPRARPLSRPRPVRDYRSGVGPGGPLVRPRRGRASRPLRVAGGCAGLPVPTSEGAGIRHPDSGLLKAGGGLSRRVAQSQECWRPRRLYARGDRTPSPLRFP